MRKSEIAGLITMARGFDDRVEEVAEPYPDPETPEHIIEDARLSAWHLILGDIDASLAEQGLCELYQEPQMMRLQPGHIYQAAERIRRRNVAAVDVDLLESPDELAAEAEPGHRSRMPAWRQAAIGHIGRGVPLEEAQRMADDDLGIARRMLGPSKGRRLALESHRGMGRVNLGESA